MMLVTVLVDYIAGSVNVWLADATSISATLLQMIVTTVLLSAS